MRRRAVEFASVGISVSGTMVREWKGKGEEAAAAAGKTEEEEPASNARALASARLRQEREEQDAKERMTDNWWLLDRALLAVDALLVLRREAGAEPGKRIITARYMSPDGRVHLAAGGTLEEVLNSVADDLGWTEQQIAERIAERGRHIRG
jgi:hypothetical protein